MESLIKYFESCGYNRKVATAEVNTIIRYNTTGIDAVSREYAIKLIKSDLGID